jgi:hypothetical protein
VGEAWSDGLQERVAREVARLVPSWAKVRIQPFGFYLGFSVGPAAGAHMWKLPTQKWISRARDLAAASLPPSLAIKEYNLRAVSTPGYVAQLYPPPENLRKMELILVQKLFHFLRNSLPKEVLFNAKAVGLPEPKAVLAVGHASRSRTANRSLSTAIAGTALLDGVRSDHAPLAFFLGRAHSSPRWDLPPIVDLVADTLNDLGGIAVGLQALVCFIVNARPLSSWQAEAHAFVKDLVDHGVVWHQLSRRIAMWWDTPFSKQELGSMVRGAMGALVAFSPAVCLATVKTWTNAWTTTERAHVEVRTCVFVCRRADLIEHYLFCPVLWRYLGRAAGVIIPSLWAGKVALLPLWTESSIVPSAAALEVFSS